MKPFYVLISVFLLSLLYTKISASDFDFLFSGRLALSIMLIFTSIGHFKFTNGMMKMLPDFIPAKKMLVYITGFLEIIAAVGIFIPSLRYATGILLILFFVLILPSNIYAATRKLNYETGEYTGKGISYLWFRIPFQILLIFWAYYFLVR